MRARLLLLLVLSITGLGAVIALPDHVDMLPSAVKMKWPEIAGNWVKVRDTVESPQEKSILAPDTQFAKSQYIHADSNLQVDVGIVLSGMDPNNSIHRPERCLVAQGHSSLIRQGREITLADGRVLPVMRLFTSLKWVETRKDGPPVHHSNNFLTYYWFVGNDLLTNSHYGRTLRDIRDRLLRGANQRWAYFTVSVPLVDNEQTRALATNADTEIDQYLRKFISEVIPVMLDASMLDGGASAQVPK